MSTIINVFWEFHMMMPTDWILRFLLTIEEINTREMAELDQELFDKLFGEGVVTSEDELKGKIKEDAERQFEQQSDQKLLNDVVESLIENTKFDLPSEFLQSGFKFLEKNN